MVADSVAGARHNLLRALHARGTGGGFCRLCCCVDGKPRPSAPWHTPPQVRIDANNMMAGQMLTFTLEVAAINEVRGKGSGVRGQG